MLFQTPERRDAPGKAPLFSFADMRDHKDPTADIAIARVDRERRRLQQQQNRPEPKPKKEYTPEQPVDWHKVFASPNKHIRINKAWMFKSEFERTLNEHR